ncbi:TPA: Mpv17/PMP22 family protein [Candidatus Woesearchaeota archaeon]|nr:Mpv17/PMP22 family protein [Candidatus Woesearchaeota archaeon]
MVQYINYSYVPLELQTPMVLTVSFAWIIVLSFWSLIARKKLFKS